MKALRLILNDQLSMTISCLNGIDKNSDIIMMCEVMEEASYVPHHPKKIAFLFSAMRHFAKDLEEKGYKVIYVKLDDPQNTGTLDSEVARVLKDHKLDLLILTEPGEWRLNEKYKLWQNTLTIPIQIREDNRFLCNIKEFQKWAQHKKPLRMEYFYREMRKKYSILMEQDGTPVGGKWNYDRENRKPPQKNMSFPKRVSHKRDWISNEVIHLVHDRFEDNFGTLEPFYYAVTRNQALKEARHFMDKLLLFFGDYQDAMISGESFLYHSLLSSYLNVGLLLPIELCKMAEVSYLSGKAPLNCVEGFIRQILGWREFVRGIYWNFMPEYASMNYLNSSRSLPAFYWGKPTHMFCIKECVRHTKDHAYSHHIQRLMVTGNFALLAGINPVEVCEWYLAVYSDAYEWVELPNTLGMALFGDGGIMASKPYAASGKYIHRMSNFCENCRYDPNETLGEAACPFNSLYWDFIDRNEDKLRGNPRMNYAYGNWNRFKAEKKTAIRLQAADYLKQIAENIL